MRLDVAVKKLYKVCTKKKSIINPVYIVSILVFFTYFHFSFAGVLQSDTFHNGLIVDRRSVSGHAVNFQC